METLLKPEELYKRDPKLKPDEVKMILDYCEKQAHLPKILELQAALALHSCHYSVEAAKNCLDSFFTIRSACPDIFGNTDPDKNHVLKENMDLSFLTFLPDLTPEGYTVALTKLMDTNPTLYSPITCDKIFDMCMLYLQHTKGPSNGLCVVIDMKGSQFGHMTKLNLGDFKKFSLYIQTAALMRLEQIHFINVVAFMDKLMAMIRPFINKELYDKIHIHTNNENLYKYIPHEILPIDYGGKAKSVEKLNEEFKQSVYDAQWLFNFLETQSVDESKRTGPTKNASQLFGFEGTFKKLCVD